MSGKYHGQLTRQDGSHVPLTAEMAEALWDEAMRQKDERAKLLPTEDDCFAMLARVAARLDDLGWSHAIYCPKDGTEFLAAELGCSKPFPCFYEGEWPKGHWVAHDDGGDCWTTYPSLYREAD